MTGFALNAATRTAWKDKVRTLGRSLASGLLADDNAKIDTEQMIIAAIADIEGPQLALLELLVCWQNHPRDTGEPLISTPLDPSSESHIRDGRWRVADRKWSVRYIDHARPSLAPIVPSLIGTLQRHGLTVRNDPVTYWWEPTELGEQVFLRFRDAGTDLPDVWSSGPAGQQ